MTEAVVCVSSRDATIGSGARARAKDAGCDDEPESPFEIRRARVFATLECEFVLRVFITNADLYVLFFSLFYVWMFPIPLIPAG